ncbi:MAG: hypothetical protein ACYTHJ_13960 [Planctomycetota bacterium]
MKRIPSNQAVMAGILVGLTLLSTGCIPVRGQAFRDNALPAIESGVELILDGVVDGLFAAIQTEPGNDDASG